MRTSFSFFLCLLLLLFAENSFAQVKSPYKKGDVLTVFYIDGLNFRKEPSIDSEVITRLNFGTKVTVIDDSIGFHAFEDDFIGGYMLKGAWVLVECKEGKGYVFDGYLSSLKIAEIEYDVYGNMKESLEQMLKDQTATEAKKKHKKGRGEYTLKTYKNGWTEGIGTYNDCQYHEIRVSNLSFNESLLLARVLGASGAMTRDVENKNIYHFNNCYSREALQFEYEDKTFVLRNYTCPLKWEKE
ncbi:MAG: SH3 domain-containing protein [Bacteroidia bacterium]